MTKIWHNLLQLWFPVLDIFEFHWGRFPLWLKVFKQVVQPTPWKAATEKLGRIWQQNRGWLHDPFFFKGAIILHYTPENDGLEDDFSSRGVFSGFMVNVSGGVRGKSFSSCHYTTSVVRTSVVRFEKNKKWWLIFEHLPQATTTYQRKLNQHSVTFWTWLTMSHQPHQQFLLHLCWGEGVKTTFGHRSIFFQLPHTSHYWHKCFM